MLEYCNPIETDVGNLTEVFIYARPGYEFYQPIPMNRADDSEYSITCKFGRFGTSPGILVNSTLVKCITPNIEEDPANIYREEVQLSVALNGQNFNED